MLDARVIKLPESDSAGHHCHEHHQLVIGVRGEAELGVDGRQSRLDTWSACLLPTEAYHDYCGNASNHVLVIDLDPHQPAFSNPEHGDYESMAPLFERPRTLHFDAALHSLVQLCAGEFALAPSNAALHRHLSAGILHCMSGRLGYQAPRPGRTHFSPEAIRRYVMENLHRKISVEDLAGVACLSVSRFYDMFRTMTGTTPHQYLLGIRIEQALRLISGTTLTVAEISHRTGFSSQGALTNVLQKHRGTTPSALRSAS
ncbi:MAG: helix-turn-helix domain-containing protein [Oleiphilaceae bacterium]|nr:helix-turn-helix domain-containing protein [Oleiphilaceae bacterium]